MSVNIDWKLPLSALAGGMLSAGTILWVGGHRDAMLDDHERRVSKLEVRADDQAKTVNNVNELLGRIDERIRFLIEQFAKLQAGRR